MRSWNFLVLVLLSALSLTACNTGLPKEGEERWRVFEELRPDERSGWTPEIDLVKDVFTPGESISIRINARQEVAFYVFLMLPNDDIYLLSPSSVINDNRARTLTLCPTDSPLEFFAPEYTGNYYLGVICSSQSINVKGTGWLFANENHRFDIWPSERRFEDCLDYVEEALGDRPWTLAWKRFAVARPRREEAGGS